MFGYVTPYKMELKMKDYENFKAYYCGLCMAIKKSFGNIPRVVINYDMTFLAILLDSLNDSKNQYIKNRCMVHPLNKRIMIINNKALDYAALCNVVLAYYKLKDNIIDDNSIKDKLGTIFLKGYLNKSNDEMSNLIKNIAEKLNNLNKLENNPQNISLDEISHPFADLTGFIIMEYNKNLAYKEDLYRLGYNLGKWIYIIDAYDDLKDDMNKNKFNPLNIIMNLNNLNYQDFEGQIKDRIDFVLTASAKQCLDSMNVLPLKKNYELLYNILQFGIMDKMYKIFNKEKIKNEKPI
jgi:hypothetical protein